MMCLTVSITFLTIFGYIQQIHSELFEAVVIYSSSIAKAMIVECFSQKPN